MGESMGVTTIILYALVFLAALLALEGMFLLLSGDPRSRKAAATERLRRHASRVTDSADPGMGSLLREEAQGFFSRLADALPQRRSLDMLLYRAGMPLTLQQFVVLSAVLAGLGFMFGALVLQKPEWGIAMVSLGALPLLYIVLKKRERMKKFEQQMPEGLDLICRALRAGISLEFGFKSVGEELPDPVGTEFGQVADEVSLGLDTRIALRNLSTRMNTVDMPFFTNAILIQRETGGNLAEILGNLGHVIRERIQFHGKVKALLSQARLTANILAALPVALYFGIDFVLPGYTDSLREGPPGTYILYAGVGMVVFGWLACRRIGQIDV